MLLRAGFLYILGVVSLLLGALAAWQGLQVASLKDGAVTLAERTARTQRDLDTARLEAEAAQRRALVAEDKLARAKTAPAAARDSAESGGSIADGVEVTALQRDLAEAQRERDAARTEAHELAGELATVRGAGEQPDAGKDLEAAREPGGAGSTADSAEVTALQRDLAETQRERDAARIEAHELAGELAAVRGAGEQPGAGKDVEAAREQINKLSGELEEARRSLIQAQSTRDERDAARADVQKLSGELEIARAEVLRLSNELEKANKTLAEAHRAASDVTDAQAGGDAVGAARATQTGTGSLGVTAAPVSPTPPAVTPAPAQIPTETVSIDPAPQEESATGATGEAARAAPKTPAPKRKEAKRKKRNPPARHIESSIFLPF